MGIVNLQSAGPPHVEPSREYGAFRSHAAVPGNSHSAVLNATSQGSNDEGAKKGESGDMAITYCCNAMLHYC